MSFYYVGADDFQDCYLLRACLLQIINFPMLDFNDESIFLCQGVVIHSFMTRNSSSTKCLFDAQYNGDTAHVCDDYTFIYDWKYHQQSACLMTVLETLHHFDD